jgi:hypothetical protein
MSFVILSQWQVFGLVVSAELYIGLSHITITKIRI